MFDRRLGSCIRQRLHRMQRNNPSTPRCGLQGHHPNASHPLTHFRTPRSQPDRVLGTPRCPPTWTTTMNTFYRRRMHPRDHHDATARRRPDIRRQIEGCGTVRKYGGARPPGPGSAAPDGHMGTRRGGMTAHSCCQLPHKRIDMVKLPCVKLRSFDGTPIKRAWLT